MELSSMPVVTGEQIVRFRTEALLLERKYRKALQDLQRIAGDSESGAAHLQAFAGISLTQIANLS